MIFAKQNENASLWMRHLNTTGSRGERINLEEHTMGPKNSRGFLLIGDDDVEFGVSVFEGVLDQSPGRTITIRTREGLSKYFAQTVICSAKDDLPLVTRGVCNGPRKKAGIQGPLLVLLDVDDSPISLSECSARLEAIGVSHLGFTTYSNDPEATGLHRYRIVTDILANDWESLRAITADLAEEIAIEVDRASYQGLAFYAPGSDGTREVDRTVYLDEPSTWRPDPGAWERWARQPKVERLTDAMGIVDMDEVRDALRYVTDDEGSRERWREIGMALHSTEHTEARDVWDEWSALQESGKFDPADQDRVWESFSISGNEAGRITVATIFHLAHQAGWCGAGRRSAMEDFAGIGDDISIDRESVLLHLNERYAYVSLGQGKVVDLGSDDGSIRFLSTKAFTEMLNYPRWPAGPDGRGLEKAGWAWLNSWEHRPTFDRIDFIPPEAGIEAQKTTLNLWRGWRYESAPKGGACDLYLDHLHEVICNGDDRVYAWVLAWLAHLVQKPGVKPGTAIVLRGLEGTGKGIFAHAVRELCGVHGIQVSQPKQLTGNFNSHLAGKLLVFADEVTWGGNKKDDGVLKTMITEPTMVLEAKGVDSVEVRSYCRVIISSNNEWVVPTGRSSRRFTVLDVSDARVRDLAYFEAIVNQLKDGGHAALWRYLRDLDATQLPNPTVVFATEALRDQKLESLDDRGKWLLDLLHLGEIDLGNLDDSRWPEFVQSADLHENYLRFAHSHRVPRSSTPQQISRLLKEVFGDDCLERRTVDGRQVRCVVLPPLSKARKRFEAWLQSKVDWEE